MWNLEHGPLDLGSPLAVAADRADAVVVGAGPAGSITALLLARAGLDVILVDRAEFPRPKPCGDCLSAAATGLLRRLGLLDRVRAAGAAEVEAWRIVGPSGVGCEGRLPDEPALALERRRLDPVLRDAAIEAGARPRTAYVRDLLRHPRSGRVTGVWLRGRGGGEDVIRSRLVVGADGLRSVVARRLGLVRRTPRRSKLSLTTHGPLTSRRLRHGEMHVLEDGCFGLAPAGHGRFNLTLVIHDGGADRVRDLGAERFLQERIRASPWLRERIDADSLDPPLGSGPFDWPVRAAAAPGVALVGDAAGYYDPFTGQGVHHAMRAATMLAEEVAEQLLRSRSRTDEEPERATGLEPALDASLERYARRHRRMSGSAHRLQRAIDFALREPRRADRLLSRLDSAPGVFDRLVEVTGSLRRPASLLSPSLVRSFLFPPHRSAHDPH